MKFLSECISTKIYANKLKLLSFIEYNQIYHRTLANSIIDKKMKMKMKKKSTSLF